MLGLKNVKIPAPASSQSSIGGQCWLPNRE